MDRTVLIRTLLPLAMAATLLHGLPARADESGSNTPAWARWQGRVSLALSPADAGASWFGSGSSGLKVERASLLGDYYFAETLPTTQRAGGFRATSGVIAGSRAPLWAGQASLTAARGLLGVERQVRGGAWGVPPSLLDSGVDTSPVPYFGLGYTGLSRRSRWSFSADLGMVARSPGNVIKLGRVFTGSQGVDDLLRELRLAPMLQLGMSYSF
ncbi:MAG: hypothetical protein ABIX46_00495 [Burkholderiaceae bacterium]